MTVWRQTCSQRVADHWFNCQSGSVS